MLPVAFLLLLSQEVGLDVTGMSGYLSLRVHDQYGDGIPEVDVQTNIVTRGATAPFKSGGKLTYGQHVLRVSTPGFRSVDLTVTISKPYDSLDVFLRFEHDAVQRAGTRLRIDLLPRVPPCRIITLIPLFCHTCRRLEAHVTNDKVEFFDVATGTYAILNRNGRDVCAIESLAITGAPDQAMTVGIP